jgi:hypothetical protein
MTAFDLIDAVSGRFPHGTHWLRSIAGPGPNYVCSGSFAAPPDAVPERFYRFFSQASRKLGRAPLVLSPAEAERLRACGLTWPLVHWCIDDLGRAALLLLASAQLSADTFATFVDECYRRGDNRERHAILRTLPLLASPERFVGIAIDSCRTHVQTVFESIACENPYPAAYFPELNFNQLVLKALFLGVAIERVLGLESRLSPELSRMAADYAAERAAAGRSIPAEIEYLTQPFRSTP